MFKVRAEKELPYAEQACRDAKAHLEHLESLLAEGKLVGAHTKALLHTMRQTYTLLSHHIYVLRREITQGI